MNCRSLFILLFSISFIPVRAQEVFTIPPARELTVIPFRLITGGIIVIKATLAPFPDTLNFVFDTGSGGISLDSLTALRLGLNPQPSERVIRGIAGIRQVRFIYNHTLHLPRLSVDSLNFHINDYDILTSAYGEKIDGIIGYAFLSRYIVRIDYDSSKMYVYSRGTYKYPRGGFLIRPLLVNLPVVNASVNDHAAVDYRYYFDTGAGMCLLFSSEFVRDSAFIRPRRKWYDTQAEGLGGKTPMKYGVIRFFQLGPYKFRNVPAYIFEDEFGVTSYPYLGGLIGNDLLRRFNVILNYERRDIYLIPNSHFKEPFDYSYTGLGMYYVDGEIRVVDVMQGSPAEAAGFQPGDVIMAVQNNFSGNIQVYKALLQSPDSKIQVLVMRDSGPVALTLKVKSILRRSTR